MKKLFFLGLKGCNLTVITLYSFLLIYVLVRVVSNNFYPYIVLVSSIGNYVLATDLGYSGFTYAILRKSFIEGRMRERVQFVSEAFNVYMIVSLAAAAVMAAVVMTTLPAGPDLRVALSVYFLSIVLSLPWALVRKVAAAVDMFIQFEILELIRRTIFLGLSCLMLKGLPFIGFGLICLGVWAVAYTVALLILRSRQMVLKPASPPALVRHLAANKGHIFKSGWFTVLEFLIYNFPYVAVPMMFQKSTIVAFDVFYKVVRFGNVSYGVAAETFLPYQTRAFYAHEPQVVQKYAIRVILIGLIPLTLASGVLLFLGGGMFQALLHHASAITPPLRWAMIGMLAAMLFQTASGTFLVGVGEYLGLAKLTMVTVSLMVLAVILTVCIHASFEVFMGCYVGVYAVHAVLFQIYMRWFQGRAKRRAADVQPTAEEAFDAVSPVTP